MFLSLTVGCSQTEGEAATDAINSLRARPDSAIKEVNAFALPGGFLYVKRGLLEATDDESELAGVLAHEMSHVAARHGYKLMKKAMISSILS
jgi:Zn-dependent protease with chaperone function